MLYKIVPQTLTYKSEYDSNFSPYKLSKVKRLITNEEIFLNCLCAKNLNRSTINEEPIEIENEYFKNSFSQCFCAILYDEKIWIGIENVPELYPNSILKIYNINNPEKVYEIKFTSRIEGVYDAYHDILNFTIYFRHNRIYISTAKKFEIYDFEANLLFTHIDLYNDYLVNSFPWFYVDEDNKNKIYISDKLLFTNDITKKKIIKYVELGHIMEIILCNNI